MDTVFTEGFYQDTVHKQQYYIRKRTPKQVVVLIDGAMTRCKIREDDYGYYIRANIASGGWLELHDVHAFKFDPTETE